jgi:hypothetical protein
MVLKHKYQNEHPTTEDGINLVAASKTLLRVLAEWQQNEYTEASSTENGRQAEVLVHNDLSNPASEANTTQG